MTLVPEFSFPCSADKKPRLKEWQRKLFQRVEWRNAALVGLPTGKANGFDVLDIDGAEGLRWYSANFDAIPQTWAQSTHRGMHLFFRAAEGLRCSRDKIAAGIDVRAEGGYAIFWQREGLPYEEHPICEWPGWLLREAMGKGSRRISRDLSNSRGEESESASERKALIAESATAALNQLDVLKFADHDAWFALMLSAKAVGIAVEDFVDWSTGDPTYSGDGDLIEKRWHSVPGVHAGAFYSALKAAGIKLTLPRKAHTLTHTENLATIAEVSGTPSQTPQANSPANGDWNFFQRSYQPGQRFHGMMAKLKADGREDLLFWSACEAFAMGIVEGWPSEKVARKYLAKACEANGLHSTLMKTDGTDGCQLTINNAFVHVADKIAATKEALEAEDVS